MEPTVDDKGKSRQVFVMLVKFAPGKGPRDLVDFFDYVDTKLKADPKIKMTRCEMDVHERLTYITWGRYDMVIVWDAPDMARATEFLSAWVNPGNPYGTSENLTVAFAGRYR